MKLFPSIFAFSARVRFSIFEQKSDDVIKVLLSNVGVLEVLSISFNELWCKKDVEATYYGADVLVNQLGLVLTFGLLPKGFHFFQRRSPV